MVIVFKDTHDENRLIKTDPKDPINIKNWKIYWFLSLMTSIILITVFEKCVKY